MVISVIGAGYVGLTTSAILAAAGHKVYCIDIDPNRLEIIKSGKSFFYEQGLDQFIRAGITSGNLLPTLSYEESIPKSEIVIICVGTPTKEDLEVDIDSVIHATELIGKYIKNKTIIIQKSTVPVGTGRKMEAILKKLKKDCSVISCPEFLSEGTAVLDTLNANRYIIGGDDKEAKSIVVELFRTVDDFAKTVDITEFSEYADVFKQNNNQASKIPFEQKVFLFGLESAELVKVTANAFLATKISFANSIARLCDFTGADINEVMDGIGRDERIGRSFLYAGLGWGGGCFPKDTTGLVSFSKKYNFDFSLLEGAIKTNFEQVGYVLEKIKKLLVDQDDVKTITVLGLAFKPGTSDIRMSPAIHLVKELLQLNVKLKVFDPKAMIEAKTEIGESDIEYCSSADAALKDTDIIVLSTQWSEFYNLDFSKIRNPDKFQVIVDARNIFNRRKMESLGYKYIGIGC